jgi:hypothetical protein
VSLLLVGRHMGLAKVQIGEVSRLSGLWITCPGRMLVLFPATDISAELHGRSIYPLFFLKKIIKGKNSEQFVTLQLFLILKKGRKMQCVYLKIGCLCC